MIESSSITPSDPKSREVGVFIVGHQQAREVRLDRSGALDVPSRLAPYLPRLAVRIVDGAGLEARGEGRLA